jgi:hypothetical protein
MHCTRSSPGPHLGAKVVALELEHGPHKVRLEAPLGRVQAPPVPPIPQRHHHLQLPQVHILRGGDPPVPPPGSALTMSQRS